MASRFGFASLIPLGLEVVSVNGGEDALVVMARGIAATASCPLCGVVSRRIQSRYVRQPSDLPCAGRRVRLRLLVRRFRCNVSSCLREVFAERFDKTVLAERARRTGRLEEIVHHLGLAMGGRPGAGFAQRLMLPVSNDTLLRVVRRRALPRTEPLAVIGIDDWAYRRNHRYGTIICDLERRRVVALLPDREQATAEAWLRQHPAISIVSRDRGGGYGEAVACALPSAIQVADRWHLMENASAAFLDAVRLSMRAIRSVLGAVTINPALLTAAERLQYEGFLRREDTARQILMLKEAGYSIREIARRTRHSRKLVRHTGGNGNSLLAMIGELRTKAEQRVGGQVKIVVVQEAGLDGFWVHRLLGTNGIESHVVDPGSVAVSRRRRRAKTDAIDGETLLRTLLAWQRGEPRVCAMAVPPTPEQEDCRRLTRERATLMHERVRHVNRIKGLLAGQGITDYEPLHKDRRIRLDSLKTGDQRELPVRLKAELLRELVRIELVLRQIAEVEADRDAAIKPAAENRQSPVALLAQLKSIGPQIGAVIYHEGLYRTFANRREVASYAGLTPSPWRSGSIDREQGNSKAGNPRLRHIMIELAWLWVRHQPDSALSSWFRARVGTERGRIRRITIVALARKLLIALWRYVTQGEVPKGAVLKAA